MIGEFINIVAAFKFVQDDYEIRILCEEPGYNYAMIKDNTCTTLGSLRADIKEWLLHGKEDTFEVDDKTSNKVPSMTIKRVPVPEQKHYKIVYGTLHHIDER